MRSRVVYLTLTAVLLLWTGLAAAQSQNVQITQGPRVEHTDGSSAVIAWSTNVNSSTQVKYGTDPNNLTQTASAPWGGITHRITLKNLEPNKTYYYQVISGQAQGTGTGAMSNVAQFQTTAGGAQSAQNQPQGQQTTQSGQPAQQSGQAQGGQAEVVAGPIPQKVSDTSAVIWWQTTQPTETILKYGTDRNNLSQTAQQPHGDQSHKVTLSNLQPDTQYYVSVQKPDGTERASGWFKTQSANWRNDRSVDITQGPVIEYISDNQAVIAWSTNQKASSIVRYGTDPNNLTQTAQAPWGAGGENTHRVTIKNLQPNTQYWFAIESAQAAGTGTQAQSNKFPFRTVQNASAAMRITQQP